MPRKFPILYSYVYCISISVCMLCMYVCMYVFWTYVRTYLLRHKSHYTYWYVCRIPISVFVVNTYSRNFTTHIHTYAVNPSLYFYTYTIRKLTILKSIHTYIHILYTCLCICFTICIHIYIHTYIHSYIHFYVYSYISTLMYKYVYTKHTYLSHWSPVVEIWRFWDLYVFRILYFGRRKLIIPKL